MLRARLTVLVAERSRRAYERIPGRRYEED